MRHLRTTILSTMVGTAALASVAGCPTGGLENLINTATEAINRTIDNLQEQDIFGGSLPSGAVDAGGPESDGLGVDISNEADVITDPNQDLADVDLVNSILLAFENSTGNDLILDYDVDGEFQEVIVYNGETSLIAYPCPAQVQLLFEWDFDPSTGEWVGAYDLSNIFLVNEAVLAGGKVRKLGATMQGSDDDVVSNDPNDVFDPNSFDPNSFDPNSFDPNSAGGKPDDIQSAPFACGELIVIGISAESVTVLDRVPLDETSVEPAP